MAGLRFARYDRAFIRSPRFRALPARIRLSSYAFLLAMNGYCYERAKARPPASGSLRMSEVTMLAEDCGLSRATLQIYLGALHDAGLIEMSSEGASLPRFFKWSPELRQEAIEARTDSARKAASTRWQTGDDAATHAERSADDAVVMRRPSAVDAVAMPEIREKRERERREETTAQALSPSSLWTQLVTLVSHARVSDEPITAQREVASLLEASGWLVQLEVPAPGLGRRGRLDLLARQGAEVVAIEIDGPKPQVGSLHKLRHTEASHRLLLLRGGTWAGEVPGIDAVVRLEVAGNGRGPRLTPELITILQAYYDETGLHHTVRDVEAAATLLETCPRLEIDRIVMEMPKAAGWVRERGTQVRHFAQLVGWMQRLDHTLADAKAPLAMRFQASERGGEITSIGESL